MIDFEFKPEKFGSAVAYLVKKVPGLTKKQICKLMYFADKEHLLNYGRTITGDTYYALPQGHIPSHGLDAINGNVAKVGTHAVECVARYGRLNGRNKWEFVLDADPDMKVFSRSDIRVLDQIITSMGHLNAHQLERKSHDEPSWRKTPENTKVDFELFFEGRPDAETYKEILIEEQDPVAQIPEPVA